MIETKTDLFLGSSIVLLKLNYAPELLVFLRSLFPKESIILLPATKYYILPNQDLIYGL